MNKGGRLNNLDGSRSTIERALEIARRGSALSVKDVRDQLKRERYDGVEQATAGMSVKAQLNRLIATRVAESRNV
jgi:hypothetical protein